MAEVGRDDEAAFGRGEAIGFAGDFLLPKSFASGGVENGDLIVEADDELISGDDEFEGSRVRNLPEEALFQIGLRGRDGLFDLFDFGEVCFDLWVEFFELCLADGEGGFQFAFAGQIETLEFVDGVEVGFPLGDDDAVGVVEGRYSLAGGCVRDAELFITFALVGWTGDELVVFGEEAEDAARL